MKKKTKSKKKNATPTNKAHNAKKAKEEKNKMQCLKLCWPKFSYVSSSQYMDLLFSLALLREYTLHRSQDTFCVCFLFLLFILLFLFFQKSLSFNSCLYDFHSSYIFMFASYNFLCKRRMVFVCIDEFCFFSTKCASSSISSFSSFNFVFVLFKVTIHHLDEEFSLELK